MSDEMRMLVVAAVVMAAAIGIYAYWARNQRQQVKSDTDRRARRDNARLITNEPAIDAAPVRVKAAGFGRR